MKNIFLSIIALLPTCTTAQIAIGKTSVTNTSVSLEFGNDNKGFILPWITNTVSLPGVVNGTFVYDLTDHKVKVKYVSGWKDLSVTMGTTVDPLTSVDGVLLQNPLSENDNSKVSIGTTVSATPGILVLEDNNKAKILPKVTSPHLNIINPSPGMMVYDNTAKLLAVFNGNVWTFWKP